MNRHVTSDQLRELAKGSDSAVIWRRAMMLHAFVDKAREIRLANPEFQTEFTDILKSIEADAKKLDALSERASWRK